MKNPLDILVDRGEKEYDRLTKENTSLREHLRRAREEIPKLLDGIDRCEASLVDPPGGWWETSAGERFGAEVLRKIVAILEAKEGL